MKKWTGIVVSLILLITGLAYAKEYEIKKRADNYDVKIKIDRNPPVAGNNNIEVEIKDGNGKYVTDAKVKIEYSMPAMPGMPPTNYKADAEVEGNKYRATLNFSMTGSWNILIKITRAEKTSRIKFNIDVS